MSNKSAADIIDYAENNNVNLIVVGAKGRRGFKRLLLGSVASGVVTYAHCPVIVVKSINYGSTDDLVVLLLPQLLQLLWSLLSAIND